MEGSFLGPSFGQLKSIGARRESRSFSRPDDDELIARMRPGLSTRNRRLDCIQRPDGVSTAALGRVRSSSETRVHQPCSARLNLKVKFRESFRPLLSRHRSLREESGRFDLDRNSPYCLSSRKWPNSTARDKRRRLRSVGQSRNSRRPLLDPASLNVDYPPVSDVDRETIPRFHRLLTNSRYHDSRYCEHQLPNVRGNQIVCTPEGRLSMLHEDRSGRVWRS